MNEKKNVVIFDDIDISTDYMQIYEISLQQVYNYIMKWGADKIKVEYPEANEEKYLKRIKLISQACNYSYKLTYEVGYYESGKTWLKLGAELTKNQ